MTAAYELPDDPALQELVERARSGEVIYLTVDGAPVVDLVPHDPDAEHRDVLADLDKIVEDERAVESDLAERRRSRRAQFCGQPEIAEGYARVLRAAGAGSDEQIRDQVEALLADSTSR